MRDNYAKKTSKSNLTSRCRRRFQQHITCNDNKHDRRSNLIRNFLVIIISGEGPDGTKYKTAYRCEGETLDISCEGRDETIEVVRANYGRFSIAICNQHGFTDWSVNCMAPRTKRVLKSK